MAAKKTTLGSNPHVSIYQVKGWFVAVNHLTRRCQITGMSGDMWFDASRQEAARLLRYGN